MAHVWRQPAAMERSISGMYHHSRKRLADIAGHTDRVWSVAYRPDGKQLATLSFDGTVKIWDAVNGKELLSINLPGTLDTGNVGGVSYSPDGKASRL